MSENLKVLVVDDEETILDIFTEYLEFTNRYTVFTAADGLKALDIPFYAQAGWLGARQENPSL